VVAAAEAKRKADEAERQRLADVKAEQERQARVVAEADAKRKVEEAERQRLAAIKAEEERERAQAEAHVRYGTLMQQGARYYSSGNYDGAIASFSEAIRLDPKAIVAFFDRAIAYEKKGDNGRALADYNEVLRLDPNSDYNVETRAAVLRLSLSSFTSSQDAQTPSAAPAAAPSLGGPAATTECDNPNALGVSRKVEIDTTGGPGFGFQTFKAFDFLRDHEIVLTFDDGPWPENTPAVLKALADQCTKALFFPIGKHAGYYPEIMKQVVAAGHTIGTHTWSHRNLSKLSEQEGKDEIEKGIAAISIALGGLPVGPFFRFPALQHPPGMVKYLGERDIGIFSTDIDSNDAQLKKPEEVVASVMKRLETQGKGIIQMHDFLQATANAAPQLLKKLKDSGYKVVQIVGKTSLEPKKKYTDIVLKEMN
jgi:peptidoglycan/xylan/chitin deacetylase (PgdA/CDA1 family)